MCACKRYSVNITCSGRDLSDFYTRAGFLPFANLSALPWKYFANRVVIITVILFHRNSSAGCLMNTYHTHTHICMNTHVVYANTVFDPSTSYIVCLFEVWAACMSLSLYLKWVCVCITMCRRHACVCVCANVCPWPAAQGRGNEAELNLVHTCLSFSLEGGA